MTFLNFGLFAAGAAAVSIPIIIHFLFRRRRKPVVWAAMRFLLEAYRKHQRRLKLEHFLLLATRCLLLLLVAMALGRPVARSAAAALGLGGGRTVYFLIDTSLTASARDADSEGERAGARSALDRHKQAAQRMLASLGQSDRAGLITLASPAESVVIPPSPDLSAVGALIDQLEATEARADVPGAFSSLAGELRRGERRESAPVVVLLSDFLTGGADTSIPLAPVFAGEPRVRLLASEPAQRAPGNVQVMSIQPLRSVVLADDASGLTTIDVRVRLRRVGAAVGEAGASNVRVSLIAPDEDRALSSAQSTVRWRPGQSEADAMLVVPVERLDQRPIAALVASIDRDAIEGDNIARRPIEVRGEITVGVAARRRFGVRPGIDRLDAEDWLRLALSPIAESPVRVIDVDPSAIDAPALAQLDALAAPRPDLISAEDWARIASFVRAGGLLIVTPPSEATVHLWSDVMTESLSLPWRIAREPVEHADGVSLSDEIASSELLELISGELPTLARSVRIFRSLPMLDEQSAGGTRAVMSLSDGSPWLIASPPGAENNNADENGSSDSSRGLVVYLASSPTLDWTDLPARPLMVPLMQEIVRQGVGVAEGGHVFTAGERPQAPARTRELTPLSGVRRPVSVAPTGIASEPIRRAGMYLAMDAQGARRAVVAVNPDVDAGRTGVQERSAVREWLLGSGVDPADFQWLASDAATGQGASIASADDAGASLSLPLLIAALCVALLEVVLARVFSHATRPASTPIGAAAS